MRRNDGWEGLLDEGEEILWQGRPDGAWAFSHGMLFSVPFALFFTGFAVFWMVMASSAPGPFWMFGLLHFGVGVSILVWALFGDMITRRYSWYTLTNRRACIATDLPLRGRKLTSYPIQAHTRISLEEGEFATLNFATRTVRGEHGSREVPVGFQRIADGREVYRIMRDLQTIALADQA